MKKIFMFVSLIFFLAIFLNLNAVGSFEHYVTDDTHPGVEVTIENRSDAFLSITINSHCSPRIILKPLQSAIIKNCLWEGLRYQGVAVFYTNNQVLERIPISAAARPNDPWIFCRLPKNKSRCD